MNASIKKEIRTLLPMFAVTALAPVMTLPLLMFWQWDTVLDWSITLAVIGSVAMGVMVFGDEYANRTMGLLLSQPLARSKIWRGKMAVLGASVMISFLILTFWAWGRNRGADKEAFSCILVLLTTFALVIFCTTPFWTFCIKNTLGAAAASFIAPGALIIIIGLLVDHFPELRWQGDWWPMEWLGDGGYLMALTAAVYFGFCYWLGRRMFLKLQVIEGQGREISLPAGLEQALARPLKIFLPGHGGPTRSLLNKELHLQRVAFLVAALYCVVFFLGAAGWKLSTSDWALTVANITMITMFALDFILIPFIAGGVCVAEERNWGMLGYQLALPPSKLRQWIVKTSIAMATSLLLGVVLPFIFYCVCKWLFHLPFDVFTNADSPFKSGSGPGILNIILFYFLLTGVSIYASSLTTNTLRAVVLAVGLIIAAATVIPLAVSAAQHTAEATEVFRRELFAHGRVFGGNAFAEEADIRPALGLGANLLLALLLYLGFTNFRAGHVSVRRRWQQPAFLVMIIGAMVFIVTFLVRCTWG